MIAIYIPVFRFAISYSVSFGRRWTALEHMILLEMISDRCSAASLAKIAGVPERLIVEALINLLRAGWIEIRMAADGAYFKATAVGTRRASEETLPSVLLRRVNWTSMCLDRLTGAWIRTDDLELIHETDLPTNAIVSTAVINTFEREDGELRNLVYIGRDETFESFEPNIRPPSVLFAKINIEFGDPLLPSYAPLRLREAIRDEASELSISVQRGQSVVDTYSAGNSYDNLSAADIIVGRKQHKDALLDALERAANFVVVHSCFLHPATLADLAPSFARAATRGVRVELLWGLHNDPEDKNRSGRIAAARSFIEGLPTPVRGTRSALTDIIWVTRQGSTLRQL